MRPGLPLLLQMFVVVVVIITVLKKRSPLSPILAGVRPSTPILLSAKEPKSAQCIWCMGLFADAANASRVARPKGRTRAGWGFVSARRLRAYIGQASQIRTPLPYAKCHVRSF